MSTSTTTAGPSEASQPPAPPKLKSSCDMCSASKVRCESQKPACSRCLKLGYPCFYSAARRVGRRHGSRRAVPGNPSAPRQVLRTLIERQGPPSAYGPGQESTGVTRPSPPTGHGQGPSQDVHMSSGCLQTNSAPQQADRTAEQVQEAKTDSSSSNGDRQSQSESPNYQLVAGCGQPSEHSFGNIRHHGPKSVGDETGPADCAIATMILQEQLDYIYKTLFSAATQSRRDVLGIVDAAMRSISFGLNRLSTVLICPCSERLDISLLVGTSCMSIMEIYGLIVKLSSSSHSSQAPRASWSPDRAGQPSAGPSRNPSITMEGTGRFEDDDPQYWALSNLSPRSQEPSQRMVSLMDLEDSDPKDENAALERIVEELPKLAGITLQFTRRSRTIHGPNNGAAVSEVAYALASYARTRFQTLKNEVTGQLLYKT